MSDEQDGHDETPEAGRGMTRRGVLGAVLGAAAAGSAAAVAGSRALDDDAKPAALAAPAPSGTATPAAGGKASAVLFSSPHPFAPTEPVKTSWPAVVIGHDGDSVVYCRDESPPGDLGIGEIAADGTISWFNGKGIPAEVDVRQCFQMVRRGDHVYLSGTDRGGPVGGVWRSPAEAGATPFQWQRVVTGRPHTHNDVSTNLAAGSKFLFYGEYGDPDGGPVLYRSADGTTWDKVWSDGRARHIHGVAEDPYAPGTVWMTTGDATSETSVLFSADHGATWTVVVGPATDWQSVQISFSKNWVWFSPDRVGETVFVMSRAARKPLSAAGSWHAFLPFPGSSTTADRYNLEAYWGAVDPATEVFYGVSNDASANANFNAGDGGGAQVSWRQGLFCLTRLGAPLTLLEPAVPGGTQRVYVFAGHVWTGQHRRPLLELSAVPLPA